jgi:uncharacterized protein (DUF427 family)
MSGFLLEEMEIPQIRYGPEDIRLEPIPKRVRAFAAGEPVVDSNRAQIMFEAGYLPVYYVPKDDVRMELLKPRPSVRPAGRKGPGTVWAVESDAGRVEDAFFSYEETPEGCPDLSGLIGMYWARMDTIFEEEEEVFGHARDPYHRVEVLRSSKHIRVAAGDVTLAETNRPMMLLETNLPVRYYIPKLDVRFDRLTPSDYTSMCPYKGKATQYWSVPDGKQNVGWSYPFPRLECSLIANHVAFYSEMVDVYVDGVKQDARNSPFA